jgi:hypothetical protein
VTSGKGSLHRLEMAPIAASLADGVADICGWLIKFRPITLDPEQSLVDPRSD